MSMESRFKVRGAWLPAAARPRAPMLLALSALLLAGCHVYRFSSPDFPTKVTLPTADWPDAPRGERFAVAKVRGSVGGGAAGKVTITPEELNRTLVRHWPELFAVPASGGARVVPLTVNLGGDLPFYGSAGGSGGDISLETGLYLVLGVVRTERTGCVTARILVENAVWSDKAGAVGKYNAAMCCQPLLFPVAYPLLQAIPPRESDWPVDTHFGSIAYADADRMQRIATDLAAVAVARAVTGLSEEQVRTIRGKALLTGDQLVARRRLAEGAQTKAAVGADGGGAGNAVAWAGTAHEYRADGSLAARGIPDVLEQRYDPRTRKGVVRADLAGCDGEAAYRYLTGRLIPAICETKNIVLDVESPPPAGALYRTLKEERENGSGILAIEFEAVQ